MDQPTAQLAGAASAVDDRFRERLHVLAVVDVGVAHVVHQPPPAAPDAHHLVAVAQRPNCDRPDGGIETGDVSAAGQNRDRTFSHARNVVIRGRDGKWPRLRLEAIVRASPREERV